MDDLIAKYVKKYGEEWGSNNYPHSKIEIIKTAIANRDLDRLRPIIFADNGFSREVFERLADKRLGTTQKLRWAQLRAWAGEAACAAYDQVVHERQYEREKKRAANRLEDFIDQMKREKVNSGGVIMSRLDYMKAEIEAGFTELTVNTGGAVPIYELRNPRTRVFSQFRRKLEYELLVSLLAEKGQKS